MFLKLTWFAGKRMLRGYIGLVFLMLLPLAIITVNGFAMGDMVVDDSGRRGMDVIAVGIVIGFQLVGGFYTMEYMKEDLFTNFRWRMQSLPLKLHVYAYSILTASTLFSAINGFVIVLFTHWVYGVEWGNIGWVVLVLILVSLISQMVFLTAVLGFRKYRFAELTGYAYVFIFMILAGYFFVPIPDAAIFDVINKYLNPLALGETAIVNVMMGEDISEAVWSAGLLLLGSVIIGLIAMLIGRRRLV
ncbi:ABC-2 type transport system permease protein [Virgibacillus natechei]|uniref:ABC-2 type transport system permease protein n=1 Tax=Virgibacillus natechei TaxID=1216297 RepID=A0ABS4IGD0_9BACI|nr:ABC transporter permease [Virgibacillus natechei]MBP1969084.1 ABC-2 type transport system permease protein [Virgibacillus natechei]UZD14351.1 ABC transporter permease [Virgibacillus natechei]